MDREGKRAGGEKMEMERWGRGGLFSSIPPGIHVDREERVEGGEKMKRKMERGRWGRGGLFSSIPPGIHVLSYSHGSCLCVLFFLWSALSVT